jgi:glycosyltransferase involved in cell wall biosynthesis
MNVFLASVVITSYNQASTLRLLLTSLQCQTVGDFEVVIADDGSIDDTDRLCQRGWNFPVHFVSQEDQGYRKSKILNRAIRSSRSDYLIFLDADVVLEKHFIEDHLAIRRKQSFVCGRRVDLGPWMSKKVTLQGILKGEWNSIYWRLLLLWSGLKKDSASIKRSIRLGNRWFRDLLGYHRPIDLLGSNFSVWKSDLLAVNGFNEALESYWGEDGDLFIRLRNFGVLSIGAKGACIQYHLFHPRRAPNPLQLQIYQTQLGNPHYKWADRGYRESRPL